MPFLTEELRKGKKSLTLLAFSYDSPVAKTSSEVKAGL